jgi:uncharacterized protein (DUF1778 family)
LDAHRHSLYETINGNSFDLSERDYFCKSGVVQSDPELVYAALNGLMEWQMALAQVRGLIECDVFMVKADSNIFKFRKCVDKALEILSDKDLLILLSQEEIDRLVSAISKTRPNEPKLSINSGSNINKTGRQQFYGV